MDIERPADQAGLRSEATDADLREEKEDIKRLVVDLKQRLYDLYAESDALESQFGKLAAASQDPAFELQRADLQKQIDDIKKCKKKLIIHIKEQDLRVLRLDHLLIFRLKKNLK